MKLKKLPTSYADFILEDLRDMFGIISQKKAFNYVPQEPLQPSEWLLKSLEKGQKMRMTNEKAKSEYLIVPVLLDLFTTFAT